MNDVSLYSPISEQLQEFFPDQAEQENLKRLTVDINGWEDFRREFLLGNGKSRNTYLTYQAAAKQYMEYYNDDHPGKRRKAQDIESFYDHLIAKGVSLDTAHNRICGLKFMFGKMAEKIPQWTNPFDIMPETLNAKLNRTTKDEAERDALSKKEYQAILKMLRDGDPLNYAIFRFGCTSGLRASELCGLHWRNIQDMDGTIRCTFVGKGNKKRTVDLEQESVKACRRAFRARFGRAPQPNDAVFNSTQGEGIRRQSIHRRIKSIAEAAMASGAMRANLIFSTHTCRHTSATLDLADGAPIDAVQKKLGHSSLETTQRYLHSRPDWNRIYEAREEVPV